MAIQWEILSKYALLFVLGLLPAVHAYFMKRRFGICASGPRAVLRVNLYDFGLILTTAICTAGMFAVVYQL